MHDRSLLIASIERMRKGSQLYAQKYKEPLSTSPQTLDFSALSGCGIARKVRAVSRAIIRASRTEGQIDRSLLALARELLLSPVIQFDTSYKRKGIICKPMTIQTELGFSISGSLSTKPSIDTRPIFRSG